MVQGGGAEQQPLPLHHADRPYLGAKPSPFSSSRPEETRCEEERRRNVVEGPPFSPGSSTPEEMRGDAWEALGGSGRGSVMWCEEERRWHADAGSSSPSPSSNTPEEMRGDSDLGGR